MPEHSKKGVHTSGWDLDDEPTTVEPRSEGTPDPWSTASQGHPARAQGVPQGFVHHGDARVRAVPPSGVTGLPVVPPPAPAKKRSPWVLVSVTAAGLCLAGLVAAAALAIVPASVDEESGAAPVASVPTATVERAPAVRRTRFSGRLEASERATLSFGTSGRIVECPVQIGDRVEKDTLLARLDGSALDQTAAAHAASVGEASARLRLARSESARVRTLQATGVATPQDSDRVVAETVAARAQAARLRAQAAASREVADEARLRAPFAGRVADTQCHVGELVGPGTPVVWIAGSGSRHELRVEVPETSMTDELEPGVKVLVRLPLSAGQQALEGSIRAVGHSAHRGTFPVIIDVVSPEEVRPGVTAEVELPVSTRGRFAVPIEAIVDPVGRQPRLWVVRGGAASRVDVDVLEVVDGKVVIEGELEVGEAVVVGRQQHLLPGDRVRPASGG